MFFDIDGTFIIQKIPHQDSDNVMLDSSFFTPITIKENVDISFKEIYNKVKVWGQSLETDFTASSCTYENNVYNATIDGVTSLDNFTKYAIPISEINQSNSKLNINSLGSYNITISPILSL